MLLTSLINLSSTPIVIHYDKKIPMQLSIPIPINEPSLNFHTRSKIIVLDFRIIIRNEKKLSTMTYYFLNYYS
jgi:hypothetical protein